MDVFEAIHARRSPRSFTSRQPGRAEIERLLQVAVLAPNHRMTQPWAFFVLGPEAKRAYAELRGELKSQKVEDPEVRAQVRDKVVRDVTSVPVLIGVAVRQDEDPMTREEDYAATFMGIQNLLLAAAGMGLGGYIHTGRILDRPTLREALGVPDDHRLVAVLDVGEPAEVPQEKARIPASERTTWLD